MLFFMIEFVDFTEAIGILQVRSLSISSDQLKFELFYAFRGHSFENNWDFNFMDSTKLWRFHASVCITAHSS